VLTLVFLQNGNTELASLSALLGLVVAVSFAIGWLVVELICLMKPLRHKGLYQWSCIAMAGIAVFLGVPMIPW